MQSPETDGEFSKVLAQLQRLHDCQVSQLAAKVSQLAAEAAALRAELQLHAPGDKGVSNNNVAFQLVREPNRDLLLPDPETPHAKDEAPGAPEAAEPPGGRAKERRPEPGQPPPHPEAAEPPGGRAKEERAEPEQPSPVGEPNRDAPPPQPEAAEQPAAQIRAPSDLRRAYTELTEISRLAPSRQYTDELSVDEPQARLSGEFNALVNPPTPKSGWRGQCYRVISMPRFDAVIGIVIVANAVTIGVETSLARAGEPIPLALHSFEYAFLGVYVAELGMRFASFGRRALRSNWVRFDIVLILCGVVHLTSQLATTAGDVPVLDRVMLVRVLRLARLARALRLMIRFHTLWMLVQGLMNSLMTLFWTGVTIFILLFVFSVLGMELLVPAAEAGDEYNRIVEDSFGSLIGAMTTLLQGLTLDSFGAIYRPLMLARPLTVFYFIPFLLVVSIAFMNLVTALMVSFSLEQAAKDKQKHEDLEAERKAKLIGLLREAFKELDLDGDDQINVEDMHAAGADVRKLICDITNLQEADDTNLMRLFKTLDYDCSGSVGIDEFCEGLFEFQEGRDFNAYRIMKQCNNMVQMMQQANASQMVTKLELNSAAWRST